MLTLVIYRDKPVLVEGQHVLQLIKRSKDAVFKYRNSIFTLQPGENTKLEEHITLYYHRPYKQEGISIGFDAPRDTPIQRSTGIDQEGRHVWYCRN